MRISFTPWGMGCTEWKPHRGRKIYHHHKPMNSLPTDLWVAEIWSGLFAGCVVRSALACKELRNAYVVKCRMLTLESHAPDSWQFRDEHVQRLPRGLLYLDVGCCGSLTDKCIPHLPCGLVHVMSRYSTLTNAGALPVSHRPVHLCASPVAPSDTWAEDHQPTGIVEISRDKRVWIGCDRTPECASLRKFQTPAAHHCNILARGR